ncbi:DNA helicase, partial [Tanacetum coccineum]
MPVGSRTCHVEGSVGNHELYDNVCGIGPSVSANRQGLHDPVLVPPSDERVQIPEQSNVGRPVSPTTCVMQPMPKPQKATASTTVGFQTSSHLMFANGLNTHTILSDAHDDDINHRSHIDAPSIRQSGSGVAVSIQSTEVLSSVKKRSCARRDRSRPPPVITNNNLNPLPHQSNLPIRYKHIGSCTYICEHFGALFWYDEHVKSNLGRARPRYNRCCKGGRVALRTYQIYPEYMKMLLQDCHFLENIMAYNQMFSMASLGAKIDESINNGRGPYVFKISGQLYHWIGSLCPEEGEPPRFLQLYIYDTDNEIDNLMSYFGGDNSVLRRDIVEGLIDMLDTHNALVQLFRTAREKFQDAHVPNFKVRLYNVIGAREYELPTRDMLGAIVYETGPEANMDYDIVLEKRSGHPQCVNKLHPSYMSLQFPLLFVYGQDGYSKDLKLIGSTGSTSEQKRLTMLAYYSYYLHDRANHYNYLSRAGRLFQQYVVSAFCAIEQNRIDYIREHQNDIRNEYLSGIYDAINRGDNQGWSYHYLDALAICRVHGNLSYFITFTCNVKWPEITEYMSQFPLLSTTDRADVVDRVFEMKIHQFVNYLRDDQPFGKVVAVLYTVEFQKRGLPHCHTLMWIHESVRIRRDEDIDNYITAELPSKDTDPVLQNCFGINDARTMWTSKPICFMHEKQRS